MNKLEFVKKIPNRLFLALCLVFLFGFGPKIFLDQVFRQKPGLVLADNIYTQCGGTTGLEGYPSNHTIQVTQHSDGSYTDVDLGIKPGECGNPVSSSTTDWTFKYPQCNWDTHQVEDVYQNSNGDYQVRNPHYQDGQCGYNWVQLNPECDWSTHQVYDVKQNSVTGAYQRYNYHYQNGVCGYSSNTNNASNSSNGSNASANTTNSSTSSASNSNAAATTNNSIQSSSATKVQRTNPKNFHGGYYINLAGGGADLNGNIGNYNDEADCDPNTGTCNAKAASTGQSYANGNVQRYICSGKVLNCDNSHTSSVISGPEYGSTINLLQGSPSCGKTVQLDVFDGSNNLKGFMVWYSGDCTVPATQSIVPAVQQPVQVTQTPATQPQQTQTQTQTQNNNQQVNIPSEGATTNNTYNTTNNTYNSAVPSSSPSEVPTVVNTSNTNVKQLPNTGLPISSLILTGLIPLGVKLRKFGKTVKDYSAASLWTNRELMK